MQENHRPKVTMLDEQNTNLALSTSTDVTVTIDGRIFVLEEPSALDYSNYLNAAEREDRKMLSALTNDFLIYIKSIDGIEFKKPITPAEITAGLMRVGKQKTVSSIKKILKSSGLMESLDNVEETKEELKK
jgi:hypothetical protein